MILLINCVKVMVDPSSATPALLSTIIASMLVMLVSCIVRVVGLAADKPLAMDRREAVERSGELTNEISAFMEDG